VSRDLSTISLCVSLALDFGGEKGLEKGQGGEKAQKRTGFHLKKGFKYIKNTEKNVNFFTNFTRNLIFEDNKVREFNSDYFIYSSEDYSLSRIKMHQLFY